MTFGRGPLVLGTFGRGPWDMVHLDMVLPHPILRSLGRGLRTPCLSDMVLGHRVFGHHPRTFPIHPTPPRHIPRGTASVWSRSLSDQVPGDETGTIPCYMQ
ncbi:hypothetical protein BATDEDRAFT_32090 [Batrachochytrium dendrobatidis JAM81]|uniref:Uncharacterized protein n=1 Tax=Batrachochytrium dendrobatidis (strain JAM81 / FGSC 10211) TaxID=684364 RepID=F4P703_BATDJ|nr:uncharacterized protein BATDEDRAFT_32090 [Batrachochytrium dendrobatidis JAM81]EGF79149.1 hypothetical protein BATDEDRAFT_32090 [Batrachochytrium dendrobatidis JAM81]|eukprot:XP_006680386.1 hypothetical protein BATDEDRAFT_32090 [Batrachochytrium dendrobatidis JAM81]